MLCPEIHGDSGLDSLAGRSLLTGLTRSSIAADRQYARAVPRMFEVISRHHAERQASCRGFAADAVARSPLCLVSSYGNAMVLRYAARERTSG